MIRTLVLLTALAGAAAAPHGAIRYAAHTELEQLERALAPGLGSSTAAQAQYDAARDLEDAVPPLYSVTPGCRPLARALLGVAAGVVTATEGVDKDDAGQVAAGRRRTDAALARVDRLHRTCSAVRGAHHTPPPRPDVIETPRSGEAFFGDVVADNDGDEARLYANGRLVATHVGIAPQIHFRLSLPPGRYDLEIRISRAGRLVRRSTTLGTYLLRREARVAHPASATDARLQRSLRVVGRSFDGYAAVYVHDLRTGRAAGWNADARFPAASTVKLGVLAAALERWHGHVAVRSIDEELRALTGWSSNLAANRLLLLLGHGSEAQGVRAVESALARLGATQSTYPQLYRVGTSVDEQPPLATNRVTTARDLGRVLASVAAAATGRQPAFRRTGLDEEEARYALGLLLASERSGPNAGLLAGGLPGGTPVAQKNGWITDVRDTAAIVYGPHGPRIVVVLTYRPGLDAQRAALFGRRVARLLR